MLRRSVPLAACALAIFVGAQGCQSDPRSADATAPKVADGELTPDDFPPFPFPGGGGLGGLGGIGGIFGPFPEAGFRWDPVWDSLVAPDFMTGAHGVAKVNPTSSPSLVRFGGFLGFTSLHAFYRGGAGNQLIHVELGLATPQRSGISGLTSAPAALVHDGIVDVFYTVKDPTGSSSHIRRARWNGAIFTAFPGGAAFEELPFSSEAVTPAVTATRVVDSGRLVTRLDVFYNDSIHELIHGYKLGDSPWTHDTVFPSFTVRGIPDRTMPPPAAISHDGQLDLFFRGDDDGIYRTTMFPRVCPPSVDTSAPSPCWSEPELLMTDAASGPAVAVSGTRTDVFVVEKDGHVYQRRSVTGGWGPRLKRAECTHPTAPDMVALLKSNVPFAAPSAVGDAFGGADLAIWGTDGNLWHDAWEFGSLIGIIPSPPPCSCGTSAGACCQDGSCGGGLVCGGGVCGACGTRDSICCAASSCGVSLDCVGGTCVCGGNGQTCCTTGCNAGLACSSDTCTTCGGLGQPCCGATCNSQALVCQDGSCVTPPPPQATPFSTTFDILTARCSSCHAPGGKGPYFYGPDAVTTRSLLVNAATTSPTGGIRVVPNDLAASNLWERVSLDDMPRSGGPLSDDQKLTIKNWILSGAGP